MIDSHYLVFFYSYFAFKAAFRASLGTLKHRTGIPSAKAERSKPSTLKKGLPGLRRRTAIARNARKLQAESLAADEIAKFVVHSIVLFRHLAPSQQSFDFADLRLCFGEHGYGLLTVRV
jgi:hypothetical protein